MALAREEQQVPGPDPRWVYEPKFDGWRALVFSGLGVLQSRRDNDLAKRFPEIAAAARGLGDLVVDGELVALHEGRLDFGALALHPGGRAAAGVTIYFIAFDLLADGADDLREQPYRVRRARLEQRFAAARPPLQLVPTTADRAGALQWMNPELAAVGIEGVVAKDAGKKYRAGRTADWCKVRSTVVVDAVVIGATGPLARPEAVVLARPDPTGQLLPIGLSLPLPPAFRDAAAKHLTPTGEPPQRLPGGVLGHPGTDYQPVHPTLVVEIQAEPTVTTFGGRMRPRVHRLRPDLTADGIDTSPSAL